jgi:DNA-binding MarR family transcriptional regulator
MRALPTPNLLIVGANMRLNPPAGELRGAPGEFCGSWLFSGENTGLLASQISNVVMDIPPVKAAEFASSLCIGNERGYAKLARQSSPKSVKPEPLTKPLENTKTIDFDIIELLFFSYRDFVSDPDAILSESGFGRAHHRVVHFVNRNPGMTVADLLDTLKITKQSLARVLKQLIDSGYIQQIAGPEDRRQRKLYPTTTGRELALALAEPQSRRIERAFDGASPEVREGVKAFLSGMQNRQNSKAD